MLIKNSKGEGGGWGGVGRQLEGLGRVVWVYKIGLKWESEKTRNRENGRERE